MASWPTYAELHAPLCVVCCDTTPAPSGCACALLIPHVLMGSSLPYASFADAQNAIAANVGGCIAFFFIGGGDMTGVVLSADQSVPDQITLVMSVPGLGTAFYEPIRNIISLNLKAGSTLTINYSITNFFPADGIFAVLYDCLGVELVAIDSIPAPGASSGTLTLSVPADGEYILDFEANIPAFGPDVVVTVVATSSDTMTANPVIALWDDSGTTRELEACPRFELPALYANAVDAQAALDGVNVSNCVGFTDSAFSGTFTATDGGTSLELNGFRDNARNGIPMQGSVNALAGETLSVAYNVAIGGSTGASNIAVVFQILDQDRNVLDTQNAAIAASSASGTLTSIPLPYSGKYYLLVNSEHVGSVSSPTNTSDYIVSSSGVMSVNPVQALYGSGTACPGRIDCVP